MSAKQKVQPEPEVPVKVGDTVDLTGPVFVTLPDGSAVSACASYTFRVPGRHVIGDTEHDPVA